MKPTTVADKWVETLRVTRFKVPDPLAVGQGGQLICEFEINRGERLYSLRWYLNDIEFFRFEPRAEQRVQLFPLPQLRLDVSSPSGPDLEFASFAQPNAFCRMFRRT